MTQNLPMPRDDRPPALAAPATVYVYPLTGPPPASIGDAGRVLQRFIDIVTRYGDELQQAAAALNPYPCALCPTNMAGWPEWQQRRHFAQHPLKERARVVGWLKAVMGT